jgi:hypothetical protein
MNRGGYANSFRNQSFQTSKLQNSGYADNCDVLVMQREERGTQKFEWSIQYRRTVGLNGNKRNL